MKHDNFLERIGEYLDGDLTEENRIEFEAHMESCGGCKRVFQEQKAAAERLELLRAEAPAGLLDNAIRKKRRKNRVKWIPAIASAAAAIAVLVGISLAGTGGSSDYAVVTGAAHDGGAYTEEAAPQQRDASEEEAPQAATGTDEHLSYYALEKNSAAAIYLYFEKDDSAVLEGLKNAGIAWEEDEDGSYTVYADDEEISGVLNGMIEEGRLRGEQVAPGDIVVIS